MKRRRPAGEGDIVARLTRQVRALDRIDRRAEGESLAGHDERDDGGEARPWNARQGDGGAVSLRRRRHAEGERAGRRLGPGQMAEKGPDDALGDRERRGMAPRRAQHHEPRREAGTPRLLRQGRLREAGVREGLPQTLRPCAGRERRAGARAFRREDIVRGLLDQALRLVAHRRLSARPGRGR